MKITRRDLLRRTGIAAFGIGAFGLAGCVPKESTAPAKGPAAGEPPRPMPRDAEAAARAVRYGTLIGPGKYVQRGEEKMVLSIIDLDAPVQKARLADLDFFGHGVSPHPKHPTRAVLFEKKGKGSCEVDLVEAKVTRKIETAEDRQFYGHGAFSRDGGIVFCTEVVLSEYKKGVIVVRDGETYEVLGLFPSYGVSPHDCRLIDGGATLAITNGGTAADDDSNPPSVTFVDVASEKLLEKLTFETPLINAGHLALTKARDLAVVSAMRDGLPLDALGAVSFRKGGGPLRTVREPREVAGRMKGESLSVAIHEPNGTVGVTNPEGDIVTFWNLAEAKFLKLLELTKARGIALTLDERYFAISYAAADGVVMQLVDVERLELIPSAKIRRSFLSGSHLIVYPLSAAERRRRGR